MLYTHALTSFTATVTLANNPNPLSISINKGDNIKDAIDHVIQTNSTPPYLATPILSTVLAAMNQQSKLDSKQTNKQTQSLRSGFVSDYQANTLQYNTKPEEDIFPRAYHTLVHCPISAIFNTLLELDQNYGLSIQAHCTAHEQELASLQARHSRDMDPNSSPSNMTHLFTRHIEEMEVLQATWASDLLQTQQTQRQEYRDFVIELYREYQLRLASLTDENNLKPEDTLAMAEKKLDGKEIVAAAAGRIPQWANKRDITSASSQLTAQSATGSATPLYTAEPLSDTLERRRQSSSASIGSTAQHSYLSGLPSPDQTMFRTASSSQAETKERAAFQKMVNGIQEMGFEKDMAETALSLCHENMEQAVAMLLEDPQKVTTALQTTHRPPAQSSSTPFRRSASLSQPPRPMISNTSSPAHSRNSSWNEVPTAVPTNRRHSTQKIGTTPPFLHLANKNNAANKSWNPISFLQQQKQVMENTNISSVRKLGDWLGKAMGNLGIENDESDPRFSQASTSGFHNSQQLVESFTITLGTAQIKSTHNLRLLVADLASDILNPLPYDGPREMAYKAQTSTKLYSAHLNAMIVLVELNELNGFQDNQGWRNYKAGKGSNKGLFERCQYSTEFHFPNIESQLATIEADFSNCPDQLQEGCFFITRHSNLPLTQVVFHLVVDSDAILSKDLSSRHDLITGLRNILRIVTRFDISSLSIPLLLLPDRYLEQPEFFVERSDHHQQNWLQKRGEVTMKCVKGFLIENSRSGKRLQTDENVFGGGMRNVEFLLPSHAAIYGTHTNNPTSPVTATTPTAATAPVTSVGPFRHPQEVELAFQQSRTLLVNLFRTS
ncbi:hypothetical protein CLU79DRAFT_818781 [Phycomyces nitens]|nr:hypothetical protein CLU79DRAFT_818781 [Phycomyces nitens]